MTQSQQSLIPTDDLPLWMRKAQRGTDWGIFIVLAFSLLASLPFFLQAGLPQTNDSEHYAYMAHDYASALREGHLYPRWSAHVLGGYGAPIPSFYPPATPYTVAIVEILFTNDTINAIRLTYILAFCVAGIMTYAFVSRFTDSKTGILASLLYVYSPYMLLTAPHILGDLQQMLALALLPALLWGINRLLTINNSFDFFLTTLISTALVLTDLRYALIAFIVVLPLLIYHFSVTKILRIRFIVLCLAWLLSACLSGFFWIPAMLEQSHIRWIDSVDFSYPIYQLRLDDLLTPLRQFDLAELVPRPQFTLGLTTILLLPVAIITFIVKRKGQGLQNLYLVFGVFFIIMGSFMTPYATWLMGAMILCLAIGLSMVIRWGESPKYQIINIYPVLLYIIVLGTAFPAWLSPRWTDNFSTITAQDQLDYEANGYGIAVLPQDWSIPVTINEDVAPNRFLQNTYNAPNIINHISTDQISASSEANVLSSTSHEDRYRVCITQPTIYNFTRAYFPGWRATISDEAVNLSEDGRSTADFFCPRVTAERINEANITPNAETGLIQIAIENPSKGVMTVELHGTDVRLGAWIITWAGLIVVSIATFNHARKTDVKTFPDFTLLTTAQVRLTTLLLIGFAGFLWLFTTPDSPFTVYKPPLHSLSNAIALQQRTDVGLELLTYQIDNLTVHHDSEIEVELTWRTARLLREHYQVQIYLQNTSSNQRIRWQESDFQIPSGYPTNRWTTDSFIRDHYELYIPSSIPLGNYNIAVEIFACQSNCARNRRVTFFDNQGQVIGHTFLLPNQITITQ